MRCRLKERIEHTKYFGGKLTDIQGKVLRVMEKNNQGDCICFVDYQGLIDVDARDIEEFLESAEPGYGSDVLNKMMEAARVMNEIDRMSQSAGSSDAGRERCESCEWREIEKQNGDGSHCYMFREFAPFCRQFKNYSR
jgi:hypothetical protein